MLLACLLVFEATCESTRRGEMGRCMLSGQQHVERTSQFLSPPSINEGVSCWTALSMAITVHTLPSIVVSLCLICLGLVLEGHWSSG